VDQKAFDAILENRLLKISGVLGQKAKEYALGGDRLHNFKTAAALLQTTQAKALWGIAAKHLVSVADLVEGRLPPTEYFVNEKIGDLINYLILLEAVLLEPLRRPDQALSGHVKDALDIFNSKPIA